MSTRVTAAIFAEEFRPEYSGQVNVIGMFPPRAMIHHFPWKERVAVMLVLSGTGAQRMRLILETAGGAEYAQAEFPVGHIEEGLPAYLHLPPRRVTLSSPDVVQVRVGFDGAEPEIVGRFIVDLADSDDEDNDAWEQAALIDDN